MGKLRNLTASVSAGAKRRLHGVTVAHPSQQMSTLLSHMYEKPMLFGGHLQAQLHLPMIKQQEHPPSSPG